MFNLGLSVDRLGYKLKVQTSSKLEPKFPKRKGSNLFYFLSQKDINLVLIRSKSEPEKEEKIARTKAKTELW